jgi:chromosome partitioning protein
MRIEPFPLPKIGVFMNKAKTWSGLPTKEAQFYIREVAQVCKEASEKQQIEAKFFKSWIPERVGVKRAITSGGIPYELVEPFKALWSEALDYVGAEPATVSKP